MIRVIIFDFDGVIVESMDIKTRAFAELFAGESDEVVRNIVAYHLANGGVSRYDKFRHIYREILRRPLPEEVFAGLCRRFETLVTEAVVAAPCVPGAREFLEEHGRRFRQFVASATPRDELRDIMERKGLISFFEDIFGAPTSKSAAVRAILDRTGEPAEAAVFVGDALSDYEAALANGVRFIVRIHKNEGLFHGMPCERVIDLHRLVPLVCGTP